MVARSESDDFLSGWSDVEIVMDGGPKFQTYANDAPAVTRAVSTKSAVGRGKDTYKIRVSRAGTSMMVISRIDSRISM